VGEVAALDPRVALTTVRPPVKEESSACRADSRRGAKATGSGMFRDRGSVRALQSWSMRSRTLTLLLALYVMLDFGSASLPGRFAFDPDDSVDAVSRASDWAEAVVPLLMKDTAGWWGHDVLEDTPVPRPVVRPRVRPVVMQSACSSAPCRDHSSPGDDH